MKLDTITVVQRTFTAVQSEATLFATRLYDHLFRLDPDLRSVFPKRMAAHKETFMVGLADIVNNLDRPFVLIQSTLKPLGLKHGRYNINPAHYDTFATALQAALAETLGDSYTSEVDSAWMETYYLVVGVMRERTFKKGVFK
jgi:hemoglobin-like flavoprotein